MNWTDEQVDRLKQLVGENLSLSQIAAEFGITRGAVSGKLNRLKLRSTGREGRPSKHGALPKKPSPSRMASLRALFEEAAAASQLSADKSLNPVTLLELTRHTCRWPLGDPDTPGFCFCGDEPVDSLPYCGRHCLIAYQPGTNRLPNIQERSASRTVKILDEEAA